ncbi:MAG: DNA polymerase III subunit beta [Betaproteobacteria bacterium]|nr:DNA polymerase III subunit beta [Betaproteobacteria bacterium]MDH3437495.1 DNA polymerase III subunit beta [Betaproteobacteria bacterium]
MKLVQLERDTLLRPLQAVTGIVEKRHTLPILSNVLIERKQGRVHFVATDLEIQVATSADIAAAAGEDVSLTVSARKLQDILRALPEASETTLDAQNNRLQIRAGRSRFNLQTLPAADFPLLADPGQAQGKIILPQKALRELLLLVQYSMAQQDIRYYLNGLLLVLDGGEIKVVATDGHRLSYAARPLGQQHEKREVILPRKAVIELAKLLDESDEPVEVEIFASQVRFAFGSVVLISKVIDGKFPDYTRVIPSGYQHRFTIDRVQLLQSLQRAAILSNEKFRGVRWMMTANSLRISCTNNEQEEAQEELEIAYSGEALDIGFNITYLLDVLNNVHTEEVECALGDANSSMLIMVPENSEFRYVVMPMRI